MTSIVESSIGTSKQSNLVELGKLLNLRKTRARKATLAKRHSAKGKHPPPVQTEVLLPPISCQGALVVTVVFHAVRVRSYDRTPT